jgi:hypothetical protein
MSTRQMRQGHNHPDTAGRASEPGLRPDRAGAAFEGNEPRDAATVATDDRAHRFREDRRRSDLFLWRVAGWGTALCLIGAAALVLPGRPGLAAALVLLGFAAVTGSSLFRRFLRAGAKGEPAPARPAGDRGSWAAGDAERVNDRPDPRATEASARTPHAVG